MYRYLIKLIALCCAVFSLAGKGNAQLNPFTIGTLNPGDSIVIYYDVTINTLCGCSQIINQGSITGSNFSSLNTDDPDTGPAGDPTITMLNMFPLPVKLLEFRAQAVQNQVQLSWTVSDEVNFLRYELEKSSNARNFSVIGLVNARNSLAQTDYSFPDLNPFAGSNFYRLKMVDLDGKYNYSAVLHVNMNSNDQEIKVYPNPATHQNLNIQFTNIEGGEYEAILYNGAGQVVHSQAFHHNTGTASKTMSLPTKLTKGLYFMVIRSTKVVFTESLLVQ